MNHDKKMFRDVDVKVQVHFVPELRRERFEYGQIYQSKQTNRDAGFNVVNIINGHPSLSSFDMNVYM